MKRVLIETGHPAQVHQFRHLAGELESLGHKVLFVSREKELCEYLLKKYRLRYRMLGSSKKGWFSKILYLPVVYIRFFRILKTFKPDIILSRFTPEASHLGWLLGIPHFGFTDSEHVRRMDAVTVPFVPVKITAHSYWKDLGKNHIRFNGNIELFYLHPARCTPDPSICKLIGLDKGERYAILRFISWGAYHDVRQTGLTPELKLGIVSLLKEHMRVIISSEGDLPPELLPYKSAIPPEKMHDALAFASIYIGEGATMATEAAMLGTPSVYINTLNAGSLEDLARAGLLHSFRDTKGLIERIREMVHVNDLKARQKKRRDEYLKDMIDVTGFVAWMVDQYPESLELLKQDPSIPDSFKSTINYPGE